jgi:hypothetical protein
MQATAAGLWPVNGPFYIEDVFSTWLYTGNGATQTITNGINITGSGALVWLKRRTGGTGYHILTDTVRGAGLNLSTNDTIAQYNDGQPTFNSNGFNLINNNPDYNASGSTYVSWTFREQPKFFDIVTYTGTGSARTVAHNLGSVPGFIIVKSIGTSRNWICYHRSLGAVNTIALNLTNAASSSPNDFNSTLPTDTVFTVGTDASLNANGVQYVAYLFAHNAGGFGVSGNDNVITCGSYTASSAITTVNLGYEPQWVMIKRATGTPNQFTGWTMMDNMRGMPTSYPDQVIFANSADAETNYFEYNLINLTATGFDIIPDGTPAATSTPGETYIYIAIRRGPMKVPTTGTSVYAGQLQSPPGGSSILAANSGFPIDMLISRVTASVQSCFTFTRLQGNEFLATASTAAAGTATYGWDNMAGVRATWDASSGTVSWAFRRAPSVMDVVCYSGNSTAGRTVTHNLTVAPEFLIVKRRSGGTDSWYCYAQPLGNTADLLLDSTRASSTADNIWNSTSPTNTTFTLNSYDAINGSGSTYVAYLFASAPGVSKVGSFTGTGATQVINCGFTGGARFVLIKATSTTGNWLVWDSARGIVAGNDPYLALNSTAAEVTNTDWVDTAATGFELSSNAGNLANSNGVSYIFLAIA